MGSGLYGRAVGWLCLSALCGYMAFHALGRRESHVEASSLAVTSVIRTDSSEFRMGYSDSTYLTAAAYKPSDEALYRKIVQNNEYLAGKSYSLLGDSAKSDSYLTGRINGALKSVKHNHMKEESSAEEDREKDSLDGSFSPGQKLRIYLMLQSLKDTSFCNGIGGMIYRDVTDKYAEHGGIVDFGKSNSVRFKRIPSFLPRTRGNDDFYHLPKDEIDAKCIAVYHLHATTYEEPDFAGPSSLDLLSPSGEVESAGEAHEFVITSLRRGRFNVDYYGGDLSYGKTNVLDLGTYRYTPADSSVLQPK